MAGLAPKESILRNLFYKHTTIAVMMKLGTMDFAKRVTRQVVRVGALRPVASFRSTPRRLPETMPGLQLVMEGVRQMRGTSVNQVKDAATCIVSNQGGIMTTHSTLILGH